jgi:hypothetical protein
MVTTDNRHFTRGKEWIVIQRKERLLDDRAVIARNAGLGGKGISPLRRRQFGGATNRVVWMQ